jgi:PAS domain S-box-containing protein
MFELLFERSADAIWLYDPETGVFVDCNDAAVELLRADSRAQLLRTRPEDLSPATQPDGTSSREKAREVADLTNRLGGYRFEWVARRFDGQEIPLEVLSTPIPINGHNLHVVVSRDISDRKRHEMEIMRLNESLERGISERTAELASSEARFRALVEHAPEAIVVFDGESGRFLFGNEHACRLYGVSARDLTRLTPVDVSPEYQPNGRRTDEYALELRRAALAGETPVVEWLHRQPSGRLIPTEVRLLRLPAEGKNLLRASITDNTERHRRELIQQATFEISEAVHTADDLPSFYTRVHGIVQMLMPARNFYIALYEPAIEKIHFPYFVDELEGPPSPFPLGTGLTSYVQRTGKPLLVGSEMNARKRRVGHEVTFEGYPDLRYIESGAPAAIWLGVPLSVDGQTFGVMAVQDYHDPQAYGNEEKQVLTFIAEQTALALERKRVEQALRESEEKYRALFAASSQGVMLHDEHQYLEVNPAAVRILGYSCQEELLGKKPADTSPPFQPNGESSESLAARHIAECMSRGSARFEWLARTSQGRDIPLEVILTRIQWRGRQIIQAFVSDISERKKAEAELHKALAREKELGQLKSNFVSMVSHEFRTPLGVILSSAEILDSYFEQLDPGERREHLRSIQRNTRRMAGLMEEVLVLGMVEAGKMEFKPSPLDLRVFCQRLLEELQTATERKCPVVFEPENVPTAALADERLLRHILSNLIGNAIKYSPAGSPVEFEIRTEGRQAICVVRDRGVGIPPEDQERLFHAFHRGANVRDVPGTGLGLTIVKRCVELHGGTLHLESAPGRGTTVTVSLPLFALRENLP